MYGPFIENRSARGIVPDQRKRFGLRDGTLKGDEEEPVAVWTPNGRIVRLAQPRRALADGVEHGLNVGRRVRDGAKNLAGRRLTEPCLGPTTIGYHIISSVVYHSKIRCR